MAPHIATNEQYEQALLAIAKLWRSPQGTPDGDRLDELIAAVVEYEDRHHRIPPLDTDHHIVPS